MKKIKNTVSLVLAIAVILATLYGIVRAYDFVLFELDEYEYVSMYGPTIGPYRHYGGLEYFDADQAYLEEVRTVDLFLERTQELLDRKYPDHQMTGVLVYFSDLSGEYQSMYVLYDVSHTRLP